jgi:hypothetical protein
MEMYFMAKSSLSWFSLAQHSFFSRNNYGKLNGIILSSGMHTSFNNTHRINSTFGNASSTSLSILVIILQLAKVLYWKLMLLGTLEILVHSDWGLNVDGGCSSVHYKQSTVAS